MENCPVPLVTKPVRWPLMLVCAMALGSGCSGQIRQGADWSPTPVSGAGAIRSPAFTCTDSQKKLRGTAFTSMRRLSQHELQSTLTALVGAPMMANMKVSAPVAGLPSDQTVSAGDFEAGIPVDQPRVLNQVAAQIATLGLADGAWRKARLGACAEKAVADDACLATVLRQFGGHVSRRDLTEAEVTQLTAWYHSVGGGETGLRLLIRRLLASPALSFHVEQGTGVDANGRTTLTSFEVASRLSYFLTDSMPDEALLTSARSGELASLEVVRAHASRLLQSPAGKAKVRDLFRYYSHLADVADPAASVAASHHIEAKGLGLAMHDEAFDFFEDVFWSPASPGTFAELLTSTKSFAKTDALKKVFAAAPDAPVGLFHRPALLAVPTERTSPIQRGAHLRKLFLCDRLGLPDPAAVQARQTELGDLESMSNREKTDALTGAAACTGCHTMINGPGFAFEGFDPMGVPRTSEQTFKPDGTVLKEWPLDTSVEAVEFDIGFPTSYADSKVLVADLAQGVKAAACFSQRVVEFYRLSTVDSDRDGCALAEAEQAAHAGSLRDVVIAAIANEDLAFKD